MRRVEARALAALALMPLLACARPSTRALEVGAHQVRVVPPKGWELLEHGRVQYFQAGEMQLSLVDLGPGTARGMRHELERARQVWIAGRRKDAFARVSALRGAPLRLAPAEQVAQYWKSWNDVIYRGETADSAAIAVAFDELIQATDRLPRVVPAAMTEYVLGSWPQAERREVARQERRSLRGRMWTELRTWDRVSHLDPRCVAYLDHDGYLLALAIERGPIDVTGPVFEGLLSTIEVDSPDTQRER